MDKVKVSDIANEVGQKPKEVLEKLNSLGLELKAANSTVEMSMADKLLNYLMTGNIPSEFKKKEEDKSSKPKVTKPKKTETTEAKKESAKPKTKKEEDKDRAIKEAITGSLAEATLGKRKMTIVKKKDKDKKELEQKAKDEAIAKEIEEKEAEQKRLIEEVKRAHEREMKEAKEEASKGSAQSESDDASKKKKKKIKKAPPAKKAQHKIDLLSERSLGESSYEDDNEEVVLPDLSSKDEPSEEEVNKKKKEVEKAKMFRQNKYEAKPSIRRSSRRNKRPKPEPQKLEQQKQITIPEDIRAYELADKLGISVAEIIKKLFSMGLMITKNDFLDKDTIEIIADEYEVEVETKNPLENLDYVSAYDEEEDKNASERAPVVTIMGHVDHGKTTLLDNIRNAKVADAEAGGITQHVGAYNIKKDGRMITFIDTPGHEAFTEMRARGAQATDVVIIVVAADDGVRPQTEEALAHAKASGVPIIIAVNKIDKPEANPDLVKSQLSEIGYTPVDWGGEHEFVHVSAKHGDGLDDLLEIILLQSELLELKANPNKRAKAIVVESSLEKGRGPVATVIVQDGTLNISDSVVVDTTSGRIRALSDDLGKPLKKIGPSEVGVITGLDDVPPAGSILIAVDSDAKAKEFAQKRADHLRQKELSKSTKVSFEELGERVKEGNLQSLPVIIKTDVQGSLEAIKGSLDKLKNEEVKVNVIHQAVGGITESDLTLASASQNCVILGFNVRPTGSVKQKAKNQDIQIRTYSIIYDLIDDIKAIIGGMMSPIVEEEVSGQAEVRDVFSVPKVGNIAGCMVTDGSINRGFKARIIRDGVVIYESNISSLKRFKDDAKEVAKGLECGIGIEKFNDIKTGDVIETFKEIERQREI
jgi:translation initiation factor IF-2